MLDQMPLPDCPMLFHAACVQLRAQNCPNYHGNSQSNLQIQVIRRWSLCHDSIEQLRYETPMQLQKSIGHGSLTRLAQLGIAGWQKVQGSQMFSTTSPQRQTWKRGKIMACRGASWWGTVVLSCADFSETTDLTQITRQYPYGNQPCTDDSPI